MNALYAFLNLYHIENYFLTENYTSSNRMNQRGEALEAFIKKIFDKNNGHSFSYLGNKNNPPDAILQGGDAIEIKKIENIHNALALNSSFPKKFLYKDDPMLTPVCRACEDEFGGWDKKDMLYIIGTYPAEAALKSIWFVYGECWIAERYIYQCIKQEVSNAIESCGLELSKTKELARVNRVDPLGITDLRVRGMWGIKNPSRVFDYLDLPEGDLFSAYFVMTEEKYASFPLTERQELEGLSKRKDGKILLKEVSLRAPDNPAKSLKARLVCLCK